MFLIGEFSKLAHVSARLLRYYDQLGLLVPGHTDHKTGYRYYAASQLERLNRILVLRELGFTLEQIASVVDRDVRQEELRSLLLARRAELLNDLEREQLRLRQLDHRLSCLDADEHRRQPDVLERALPALQLLSTRAIVGSFDAARGHAAVILARLPSLAPPRALGPLIVVSHASEFEPDALELELGLAVEGRLPAGFEVTLDGMVFAVRQHAAVERAAICVRVGPPEVAHRAASAIARWVEASGRRIAGPSRELFVRPPSGGSPPVVEMQFPLADPG